MKRLIIGCMALTCAATSSWARNLPVYQSTGTIEIMMGNEKQSHHTTVNTVPDQPEREVHTATWRVLKPMMLGGQNITPDDVFVVTSSRPTVEPGSKQPELRMEFSLEPETLKLKEKPKFSVRFFPAGDRSGNLYVLTEGSMELDSVTHVDEETLTIAGRVTGTMLFQESERAAPAADRGMTFTASFSLDRVHGKKLQ